MDRSDTGIQVAPGMLSSSKCKSLCIRKCLLNDTLNKEYIINGTKASISITVAHTDLNKPMKLHIELLIVTHPALFTSFSKTCCG